MSCPRFILPLHTMVGTKKYVVSLFLYQNGIVVKTVYRFFWIQNVVLDPWDVSIDRSVLVCRWGRRSQISGEGTSSASASHLLIWISQGLIHWGHVVLVC